MNGLEQIIQHIRADAEKEAAAILNEAEGRATAVRADWADRAAAVRAENEKKINAEVESVLSRAESSAANLRRDALEGARSELVEAVYTKVAAALRGLPAEEYQALLCSLLTDAVAEQLRTEREGRLLYGEDGTQPDSYEVMLNAGDFAAYGRALLADFRKTAPTVLTRTFPAEEVSAACERVTLANRTARIDGGLVLRICRREDAERRDGNIEINCSIASLMQDIRAKTEREVLEKLFPKA